MDSHDQRKVRMMKNMRHTWFLALFAAWSGPALAVLTTSLVVTGQVATPGTYDRTALQGLPQTTETVTYTSAGVPVTDTFTGPALWGVLQAAGGITVDPAAKNDVLNKYVIATGSDGYKAVISAGEISPRFGAKPDLVAITDTAGRLPGVDGVARTVAAGDKAGGRYVSNLTSLEVGSAPRQAATDGQPTTQFVIQGAVGTTMTFDLTALQALTPHTETVSYMSGSTRVTDTYTGALLWDVLGQANISLNPGVKNDILRKVVSATGSDGYQVSFAAGEISPMFGNAQILVAYSDLNGEIARGSGFARLVVPGDLAGGRYVSNLASLTVSDPTIIPEPASLALLSSALIAMTMSRRWGRPVTGHRDRATSLRTSRTRQR